MWTCCKHISEKDKLWDLPILIVENISVRKNVFGLDNFGDHISALRGVIKAFTGSIAYCSICSAHNKFADRKVQVCNLLNL